MSAELDMSNSRANMAYVGETPWHRLGQRLTAGQPISVWQQEAGLYWSANESVVKYDRVVVGLDGRDQTESRTFTDRKVIHRSDTGAALSVVGKDYKVVQPIEVLEFYRDLTERHGFVLETAGSLRGGRKIWALAKTPATMELPGRDRVDGYVLLSTSYDGTSPTTAQFTSIRVVCANTLAMAVSDGGQSSRTLHSSRFDADSAKLDLKIGDSWAQFKQDAEDLARRPADKSEVASVFLAAYLNINSPDGLNAATDNGKNERRVKSIEKLMDRLTHALFNSPGAQLESARGSLWGAVNAVTYDIDHEAKSKSDDVRLDKAWFTTGKAIKSRAFAKALEIAHA